MEKDPSKVGGAGGKPVAPTPRQTFQEGGSERPHELTRDLATWL